MKKTPKTGKNRNTKVTAYPNLQDLTEQGYATVLKMVEDLIKQLEAKNNKEDRALSDAVTALKRIVKRKAGQEVLMALLGEMSSGKTSLINAALGYPLFPVAMVTTSACPVEIRYRKKFKLQVFTIEENRENVIFTFDNPQMLSPEQRQALLEYTQKCVTRDILVCENFDYYFDIRRGEADLNNVLHCAQLLIALFNGYVGQDYESVSEERQGLIEERERLFMDILKCPADTGIGIRVWIDSDILKQGLTLVDLPGLGSDTETHTAITTGYINRAHCCVMLFGLDGKAADNREALKMMQNYEIMRYPGKSSRFVLVINKCDRTYEADDYYSSVIKQAARTVYDTLHSIEIREIIPISARYAEYRYVLKGIPPEKTMLARKRINRGKSREELLAELQRNYTTDFEYTDPHSQRLISYSTQKFFDETIGQYSTRIRFLNLARSLAEVATVHQETLDGLQVETKMIAMLEVLGSDLMEDLTSRMNDALSQTQEDFIAQMDEIKRKMEHSRLELAKILKEDVLPCYEKEIGKADRALNAHMERAIGEMQANGLGRYPIGGMSTKGQANKVIFNKMRDDLVNFSFIPYLEPGDTLLKDYLDRQRKEYNAGVTELKGCFEEMPAQMDQALDKAYAEFLESDRLKEELAKDDRGTQMADEVREIYRQCFADAKQAIKARLFRLSENMIRQIKADESISKEIHISIGHIQNFFSNLVNTYHNSCSKYLQNRQMRTFIIAGTPFLNVKKIRAELSLPFYEDENRRVYVGKLEEKMIGQAPDSHNSRLEKAQKETFASFTREASRRIGSIRKMVSSDIAGTFGGSAEQIRPRYEQISDSVQVLEEWLNGLESSALVTQVLERDDSWAKEAVLGIKDELSKTHVLLGNVQDEVNAQLHRGATGEEGQQ